MTIELKDLSFCYRRPVRALADISARIEPGLHLLIGENGAGKTTLLHIIAGLLFPSEGTCRIDGGETRLRLPSIASKVFLLDCEMNFPARTIEEMVRIHAPFYPRFSRELLDRYLDGFGRNATEKLRELSPGNRRKAMVAYALALRPEILLLDEPANGMDIESRAKLEQMMADAMEPDRTIIVSTHSVDDLRNLYDGVIMMCRSELLFAMTTDAIAERLYFATEDTPDAASLFSRQEIACYRSIKPNRDGRYSDVDVKLLYLSLHSPSFHSIMSILKS